MNLCVNYHIWDNFSFNHIDTLPFTLTNLLVCAEEGGTNSLAFLTAIFYKYIKLKSIILIGSLESGSRQVANKVWVKWAGKVSGQDVSEVWV